MSKETKEGTPQSPVQESTHGFFEDEIFNPGDRVITFTQRYRNTLVNGGTYLGVIKTTTRLAAYTRTALKYVVRRDDGTNTYMHYPNFISPNTPLDKLVGHTI